MNIEYWWLVCLYRRGITLLFCKQGGKYGGLQRIMEPAIYIPAINLHFTNNYGQFNVCSWFPSINNVREIINFVFLIHNNKSEFKVRISCILSQFQELGTGRLVRASASSMLREGDWSHVEYFIHNNPFLVYLLYEVFLYMYSFLINCRKYGIYMNEI